MILGKIPGILWIPKMILRIRRYAQELLFLFWEDRAQSSSVFPPSRTGDFCKHTSDNAKVPVQKNEPSAISLYAPGLIQYKPDRGRLLELLSERDFSNCGGILPGIFRIPWDKAFGASTNPTASKQIGRPMGPDSPCTALFYYYSYPPAPSGPPG